MEKGTKSLLIRVYGIVQGVGFRPSVSRMADRNHIAGSVSNKGPYVEIYAKGSSEDLDSFLWDLENDPPKRAVILKISEEEIGNDLINGSGFEIIESEKEEGEIFVSPDIAICDDCKRELFDKNDRRYLHPFINCTSCGPRVTILDGMPYDRERTSMKDFPMCPQCEYEYTHAETRRYDAQPVCCNDCGPEVYLLDPGKKYDLPVDPAEMDSSEKGPSAITAARHVIAEGGIVAVKGIGGFHLCCDALSEAAVARLRKLKRRPAKPFAVMMRDMETVRRECEVLPHQEKILDGHQKPIILMKKKNYYEGGTGTLLAPSAAPENPTVGVMLPYAPLQLLLFTYDDEENVPDCLVMTSANVSGAPIVRDDEGALSELSGMCDMILSHNRLIRLRADDSVMDFYDGRPYMIRRSRGYAPLPFMPEMEGKGTVLAIGGELKNTFCIAKHRLFYPSPYVGDMADVRTVKALSESIGRMEELLEAEPELAVCDLHPGYNTTGIAEDQGIPVEKVQHHYAHILSCMAENDHLDPVIGVSFDGTGYGTDGTIWGGEFMTAGLDGFERMGSIEPFLQTGGDISAKEGWRIAVSMIYEKTGHDREKTAELVRQLGLCDEETLKLQFMMADRKINSVMSTSAGRLFDAVSAVLDIRKSSTFEGEASNQLMFAAEGWLHFNGETKKGEGGTDEGAETDENGFFRLPTGDLVMDLAEKKLAGEDTGELAYRFHSILSDMIVCGCEEIRKETGIDTAALSGGVFQNRLLVGMCDERLRKKGFKVLLHSMIPPNDGGICLGQALYGMNILNRRK